MHAIHMALSRHAGVSASRWDTDELLDAIWAHSAKDDGLEHVRLRAGPDRMDLVFFLHEDSEIEPFGRAMNLVLRTLRASKDLSLKYQLPGQTL
jgi:hypothetical protein